MEQLTLFAATGVRVIEEAIGRQAVPPLGHLLVIALEAAVPLRILEIRARGGLVQRDIDSAQLFADELGSHGDQILYRGDHPGVTAGLFNQLAQALAVLAHCPGGVTLFGSHWEA